MRTSRVCETCGESIPGAAATRTKFCSGRCRQQAYRNRQGTGVPVELRDRDRWVRHSRKKVPLTVDGRAASSTDPTTWAPYSRVRGFERKGFVLNGDGIVCLDLDHCVTNGVVDEWARDILETLPKTYVEVSASGTGLHVFGYATVVLGRKIRDHRNIEIYGTGRFIAITGRRFSSTSRLADISAVVAVL